MDETLSMNNPRGKFFSVCGPAKEKTKYILPRQNSDETDVG